jgi:hypothetical protein
VSQAQDLPAGTTVRYCPLCPWTHNQLPPTERELMELASEPVTTYLRRQYEGIEAELEAHLSTHGLVDWLTEVNRLRAEQDTVRSELTRVAAEKQRSERHALLTTAILVRKLGGTAQITDAEMAAEDGTLVSIPEMHGRTLTVTE